MCDDEEKEVPPDVSERAELIHRFVGVIRECALKNGINTTDCLTALTILAGEVAAQAHVGNSPEAAWHALHGGAFRELFTEAYEDVYRALVASGRSTPRHGPLYPARMPTCTAKLNRELSCVELTMALQDESGRVRVESYDLTGATAMRVARELYNLATQMVQN